MPAVQHRKPAPSGVECISIITSDIQSYLESSKQLNKFHSRDSIISRIMEILKSHLQQKLRAHLAYPNFAYDYDLDLGFVSPDFRARIALTAHQYPSQPQVIQGEWTIDVKLLDEMDLTDPTLKDFELSRTGGTTVGGEAPGPKVNMAGVTGAQLDHSGNPMSEGRRDPSKRRSIDYSGNKDKLGGAGLIPAEAINSPQDPLSQGIGKLPGEN